MGRNQDSLMARFVRNRERETTQAQRTQRPGLQGERAGSAAGVDGGG